MPRNVEIKAIIKDKGKLLKVVKSLSQSDEVVMNQRDIFFNVPNGRMKHRCINDHESELIFYSRSNHDGPKLCEYERCDISDSFRLCSVLEKALGIKGEVVKTRRLYMINQTRIHLDDVLGLGCFVELEVVLDPNQSVEDGQAIAADIMKQLGVTNEDLITKSYIDMLQEILNE